MEPPNQHDQSAVPNQRFTLTDQQISSLPLPLLQGTVCQSIRCNVM